MSRALRFFLATPLILILLAAVQLATYDGHIWFGRAALGMGIAWVACLFRVMRAAALVGAVAALAT